MGSREKAGLALSGGGYRASLFHLGVLWRLNELGWLHKLDMITSVSGGSIVAGFLGMRWSQLKFEKGADGNTVAGNFEEVFVKPMRTLFSTTIDVPTIAGGLLNPIGSARGRVEGKQLAESAVDVLGEVGDWFLGDMGKNLAATVAAPFGAVLGIGVDAATAAWDMNPFPTPVEGLIATYDRELFHGKTLQDLPDTGKPGKRIPGNPEFVLYATNMQTGVSVRMSRALLSDYTLGEVKSPTVPLARAVAASSGFPPFYCPVEVEIPHERWSNVRKERPNRLREKMDLADGAVYDNLGLTMLEKNCKTILVSDAGDKLDVIDALPFEWLSQAVRTLVVAMDQSNKVRYGNLIEKFRDGRKKGTYWGISNKIRIDSVDKHLKRRNARLKKRDQIEIDPKTWKELLKDNDQTGKLGEVRTRLNRFTDEEQENLINWGYALADARMRLFVTDKDSPAGTLPFSGRLQ